MIKFCTRLFVFLLFAFCSAVMEIERIVDTQNRAIAPGNRQLAVSNDGYWLAAVIPKGAPGTINSDVPASRVEVYFRFPNQEFEFVTSLTNPASAPSDLVSEDKFGLSLEWSNDGLWLFVSTGRSVQIFAESASCPTFFCEIGEITPNAPLISEDYGFALDFAVINGTKFLGIGVPEVTPAGAAETGNGRVEIHEVSDSGQEWNLVKSLSSSVPQENQRFGYSLSFLSSGALVVTSPYTDDRSQGQAIVDTGAIEVFDKDLSWQNAPQLLSFLHPAQHVNRCGGSSGSTSRGVVSSGGHFFVGCPFHNQPEDKNAGDVFIRDVGMINVFTSDVDAISYSFSETLLAPSAEDFYENALFGFEMAANDNFFVAPLIISNKLYIYPMNQIVTGSGGPTVLVGEKEKLSFGSSLAMAQDEKSTLFVSSYNSSEIVVYCLHNCVTASSSSGSVSSAASSEWTSSSSSMPSTDTSSTEASLTVTNSGTSLIDEAEGEVPTQIIIAAGIGVGVGLVLILALVLFLRQRNRKGAMAPSSHAMKETTRPRSHARSRGMSRSSSRKGVRRGSVSSSSTPVYSKVEPAIFNHYDAVPSEQSQYDRVETLHDDAGYARPPPPNTVQYEQMPPTSAISTTSEYTEVVLKKESRYDSPESAL